MSRGICDKRVAAKVRGLLYKRIVRAAFLFGLETLELTKRQEEEPEVPQLKMLRFSLGVKRMDKEHASGEQHRLDVLKTKLERPD